MGGHMNQVHQTLWSCLDSGASFFNSTQPIWMVLFGSIMDGNETRCFKYSLLRPSKCQYTSPSKPALDSLLIVIWLQFHPSVHTVWETLVITIADQCCTFSTPTAPPGYFGVPLCLLFSHLLCRVSLAPSFPLQRIRICGCFASTLLATNMFGGQSCLPCFVSLSSSLSYPFYPFYLGTVVTHLESLFYQQLYPLQLSDMWPQPGTTAFSPRVIG